MSGHLCLKWNNHQSAFINSISKIQTKEKYCDATLACQGKYFPVHKIVLSTCSDYFEELFNRMQCPHPYIVFKDIESREIEMLLNYMYQGEVNVEQELLPSLIKAAETLKIKGLAVPDDLPSNEDNSRKKRNSSNNDSLASGEENSRKKRSCPSNDVPYPKKRSEEGRKRRAEQTESHSPSIAEPTIDDIAASNNIIDILDEPKTIKEEPLDSAQFDSGPSENPQYEEGEGSYSNTSAVDEEQNIFKTEEIANAETFEGQEQVWTEFGLSEPDASQSQPMAESDAQDDISSNGESMGHEYSFSSSSQPRTLMDVQNRAIGKITTSRRKEIKIHHCTYCSYESHLKANVEKHTRYKHTGERPFPCGFCTQRFTEKSKLNRHILIHTGEKPFECPRCFRRFNQNSTLKSHMSTRICELNAYNVP